MNFSDPVFSLRGLGSVESIGLPRTPVQVQKEMTFQVPGADNRHGGRGYSRNPSQLWAAHPRQAASLSEGSRFDGKIQGNTSKQKGKGAGRRRLTPGPDSKTERATETSSPLAFDLRQQNQAASG